MVLGLWGLSPWREGGVEGRRLLSVSVDGQVEDRMTLLASAFSLNFVFAGFLSVVCRVQGHVPGSSFDMTPRYGLAGIYPKSEVSLEISIQ